ncbi:MAG TPA: uroporphyrinogen-III C-methyltransferase [Terriglobales bacterium]|nr:uroporphyrinogen-III C-methyltransferase [Terriglobales bacterium]
MKGMVYLVGAGPGDPELLTLKALRVLRSAEVVLTDALVSAEILRLIPPTTLTLNVGKRCGRKSISQSEINFLLVEHASRGRIVVRLKSGDPLIFGRAGEEMEALRDAGIPFEVVPGITAALGAAAAAQIPLTDRRLAAKLVLATAQHAAEKPVPDWQALVSSESTIVLYMPRDNYSGSADELLRSGMPEETPCVVVSRACRAEQQFCRTTLRELPQVPVLPSPALIIVGHVTAHHLQGNSQQISERKAEESFLETRPAYPGLVPAESRQEAFLTGPSDGSTSESNR